MGFKCFGESLGIVKDSQNAPVRTQGFLGVPRCVQCIDQAEERVVNGKVRFDQSARADWFNVLQEWVAAELFNQATLDNSERVVRTSLEASP